MSGAYGIGFEGFKEKEGHCFWMLEQWKDAVGAGHFQLMTKCTAA